MNLNIAGVFINEYKACEISYQMFFNAMFLLSKTNDKTSSDIVLQNKTI